MDLEARILELEQELAALKATQLCSNCRRPVAATAPRAPVVPAPRPVSSSPHLAGTAVRPAMPKSSPQQVLPAPPLQPIQAAPPAHLLPPPVALVPNLPPVVQTRAGSGERLHTPLAARRKSLVPDNGAEGQQPGTLPVPLNSSGSMPLLPPLSLGQMASEDSHLRHSTNMPGQRPSLSARAARSGSVIDFVAPSGSRSARQDSVGSGSDSPFHRSPRDSVVINQHEEVDWSLFSCEGTMISVTQMRLTSDAAVQEALGAGHKLFLTVASAHGDAKSQWFLVRAAVAGPGGAVKCAWTLPRYYGSFQTLAKSLVGVVTNELPKIKASVNEGERVLVLNAYLMDLCTQLGCGSLALMRFADPFDSPSTLSLRTMQPIHEGMLELALPKGGGGGGFLKSQAYHFILTEHLCYFKTLNDETAAGIISLDYVTIDMVVDSAFPRFSFAICNLQKETLAVLSADSTKSLSEWILRIRKGKFLRTGISYGVAAGSPQEEKAAASVPKNAATKELFAAYLNSGTLPAGATLNTIDLNPMKWKPVADAPDCVVIAEGTLKEAAPQKLVEKALDNQLSSTNLAVTFMTTFRYYLKPVEFFPYFLRAWMAVKPGSETQLSQIRLLLILKQWLAFHFCDFCDNLELARWFLVFFHQHLNSGPHAAVFQKYTAVLLDLLKENALPIAPSNGGPNTMLPAVFSKEHIEIIDLNSLEIARQLTLYSFGLFSAIAPNELMFQRWNTAEKEALSPNVMRMIRRFNTVSLWVQTLLMGVGTIEVRTAMLQKLLEVCCHLLELNNFSSVWEMCSGLQGSAVRRLSDTWERLPEESAATWKRLQEFCDSTSNFKRYRSRLAEAVGPSIPHLGLCLTDLTFSEDGMKTFGENGRVNFSKSVVIGGIVGDILKRQRIRYTLKSVDAFQFYFQRLDPLTEEALYAKSLICQPREAK